MKSGHAMRWSLPLVFASQMVHGQVDLDTFERLPDPRVTQLAAWIAWQPMQDAAFPQRFEAAVECGLHSGGVRAVRVDGCLWQRQPAAGTR